MDNKYLDKIAGFGQIGKAVGNFAKNVSGENLRSAKRVSGFVKDVSGDTAASRTAGASYRDTLSKAMNSPLNSKKDTQSYHKYMAKSMDAEREYHKGVGHVMGRADQHFGNTPSVAEATKATRNARIGLSAGVAVGGAGAAYATSKKK